MRRPRVLPTAVIAESGRRWRRIAVTSLPVLAIALLMALGGCTSTGGRMEAPGTAAPAATPDVVAGNRWSSGMDERREAITRAGGGVVATRTADNQLKLTVPADAAFEAGRSEIRPALRPALDEVARGLDGTVRITIVGHTDSSAGDAVNGPLSLDRAESVREYLVQHGVRRGRLLVEGRGGRQPVASNATEAGRAANRRIEIFLSQPAS
jgi:outer membrane protein OmpA-like peptidoglycan-associated protein